MLTMQDRIDLYRKAFPKFAPLYMMNGRAEGQWIMGNNYRTKGGYGAYPAGLMAQEDDRVDLVKRKSGFADVEAFGDVLRGSFVLVEQDCIDVLQEGMISKRRKK